MFEQLSVSSLVIVPTIHFIFAPPPRSAEWSILCQLITFNRTDFPGYYEFHPGRRVNCAKRVKTIRFLLKAIFVVKTRRAEDPARAHRFRNGIPTDGVAHFSTLQAEREKLCEKKKRVKKKKRRKKRTKSERAICEGSSMMRIPVSLIHGLTRIEMTYSV